MLLVQLASGCGEQSNSAPGSDGWSTSTSSGGGSGGTTSDAGSTYDQTVLSDRPVAFWAMNGTSGTETDLTGHNNTGTYRGGVPPRVALPNGDQAVDFDGVSQFLTVPSNASMSISTTGSITWEGWIRPDVLQFPHDGDAGYVEWMGKCFMYSPSCEWEARMYDTTNAGGRCNRLSAYAFNPTANLGSGADWQPMCGLLQPMQWLYVVGEYTTSSQPANCPSSPAYPGSLDIWVDGVEWNQASHSPTGCMSQYSVAPKAGISPLNIGTMAMDRWFAGAIGKVALYDRVLTQTEIANHYRAMTGKQPSGSCANTCTL
jgi:hypothetical protein